MLEAAGIATTGKSHVQRDVIALDGHGGRPSVRECSQGSSMANIEPPSLAIAHHICHAYPNVSEHTRRLDDFEPPQC